MEKDGIIRASESPWNAPVWVVPKKKDASGKQKWRVVIDYRKLNEKTIGDAFPLPNINDILDQLGNSKYFTVIDLASGFHQIPMNPQDSMKTAFSTLFGHYEFVRMPFGLNNAPATFQRLMNVVLAGIQGLRCLVYLDDIIIFADSLETHGKRLREILERLANHNLKIQPDKCEFLRREVMYLGHKISESGVRPDPEKVKAVANFPVLKSRTDIQSFLGLAGYYRRFIENFSKIIKPLTSLLKKGVEFNWTSIQQVAFECIKSKLITQPILIYPDFTKEFILTTDASNFAIGAILSQETLLNPKSEKHKSDLPIAYASRTLNSAETNYSTIEREALAIVWAVKHFRSYLLGHKFRIVTDHRPLQWLFNVTDPSSRLLKWRLKLEEYTYEIQYKPGKLNQNADALSRYPVINKLDTSEYNSTYQQFEESLESNLIITKQVIEHDTPLEKLTSNYAVFISEDLFIKNPLIKINEHLSLLESYKPRISEVISLPHNGFKIYYLITKQNYWAKTDPKDIFQTLIKLKNLLIKENQNLISLSRQYTEFENLRWNKIRSMIRFIFKHSHITINLYLNNVIEPSTDDIPEILKEYHSSPTAGHTGFNKTYKRIKQYYKWPSMKKDICNFIKACESCQINKIDRKKNKSPMVITTTSNKPFQRIALDIVGPLSLTESGNKYILTLQDDLTKFSQAYAIPQHDAITIAKNLTTKFIC